MRYALVLSSSLVFALSPITQAAVFYEPFDYPANSPLDAQLAPNAKAWSVAGPAAPATSIATPSLTPPLQLAASAGPALQWGNNSGSNSGASVRVGVGSYTTGTVYWSLLLQIDDPAGLIGGTTGAFVAGFNTKDDAQSTNLTSAAARLVLRKNPSGPSGSFFIGTSVNSNDGSPGAPQVWDPTPRAAGATYFLVASYTFNPSAKDDVANLWIDPDPSTFGADSPPLPTLTSTGADIGSIHSFFFRQNQNGPALATADDLRVATTWSDVTPLSTAYAPEPTATLAIAPLTLLALARHRKRLHDART